MRVQTAVTEVCNSRFSIEEKNLILGSYSLFCVFFIAFVFVANILYPKTHNEHNTGTAPQDTSTGLHLPGRPATVRRGLTNH